MKKLNEPEPDPSTEPAARLGTKVLFLTYSSLWKNILILNALRSSAVEGSGPRLFTLSARRELLLRLGGAALQLIGNLLGADRDALVGEILCHLGDDVAVPRLDEIGGDDVLGVGIGSVADKAEMPRRPEAEELVA